MKAIRVNDATIEFREVSFDARLTLIDSAQVFHWRETECGISGAVGGHRLTVRSTKNGIILDGCRADEEEFWIDYFDLNRDYEKVSERVADIPTAAKALELLPGLRVLRQPAWEALVAFIISANNNVGRIRGIVARLIEALGENGSFPTPECLAAVPEETLRGFGCGYRARYLTGTARHVLDGFDLDAVKKMPYEEAHAALLKLPGVGDKVADCVQLFGMGHSMAFPVDVWVERLMKGWFVPEAASKKEIRAAAHELFGEDAGLVQQSLFHCARLGLIEI